MDFRVLLRAMLALNSVIAYSTAEQAGSKLPGAEFKVTTKNTIELAIISSANNL